MSEHLLHREQWIDQPPAVVFAFFADATNLESRRACDGATGLALAVAYQPDVLLLDIVMPEFGRLEMAMQVRRQSRVNGCLMIAVTGRADARHRVQCEEAGLDLFLIKPVDLLYLRTLLMVESEYQMRSRHETKTDHTLSATLEQLADTHRP